MRENEAYKKQPLVSVIIPVYNRMDTIIGTVDSVLNQSYKNIEIIIIDDGSTDDTLKVLERIQNEKIQILKQNHRGANAARNLGVKKAKGEYIALIDSADKWAIKKIERQVECMQENPKRDIVFCVEKMNFTDGTSVFPSISQQKLLEQGRLKEVLAKGNCIDTPTIICKQTCFEIVGLFDEVLPRCQEYEWVLRAIQKCSIYFLNECLVESNIRKDSISLDSSKLLHAIPQIYNKHRSYFVQYGTELDFLMMPVWELYKAENDFSDYETYFELLDKYVDVQWESKVKEVHMTTLKFIFSENIKRQYKIQNMQEEYDIKRLLEKKIKFSIFGAGQIAKMFYAYLQKRGMEKFVEQIIVTSLQENLSFKEEVPMVELRECVGGVRELPVVLAVNNFNMMEVIGELRKKGFRRIVTLFQNDLL